MYNVGLGSAKDLRLIWNPSINEFIEIIKRADLNNSYRIKIERRWLSIYGKEGWLDSAHSLTRYGPTQIPYVLPCSIDPNSVIIPLPHIYLALYSIWLHLKIDSLENNHSEEPVDYPPDLHLQIKFKDIANTRMHRTFCIRLNFGMLGIAPANKEGVSNCALGHIKMRQVDPAGVSQRYIQWKKLKLFAKRVVGYAKSGLR